MAASTGKVPANASSTSLPKICKFRKGDRLQIISGKHGNDRQIGNLLKIDKKKRRVVVEGCNKVFKHRKQDPTNKTASGIEQIEASIDVSNVALVCPKCVRPTKVGWRILDERKENGKIQKVRICRRCQERIDD